MSALNLNESNALLLYRVGPVLVCSPTMPVEAVIMPPKITVPPGASVAEPGVFKSIHGMVRLVDLRVRFGVEEKDFTSPGRIVIVEVEGGHAGFWVDEIEDVMGFPGSGWSQVSAYIPKHIFSKTLVQDNTIRLYADFENLDKFKSSGYLRQHIEMLKADKNESSKKTSKKTSKVPKEIAPTILSDNTSIKSDTGKVERQSAQLSDSSQADLKSNKDDQINKLSKNIKSDITHINAELTASESISARPTASISTAYKSRSELKPGYKKSQEIYPSKNHTRENKIAHDKKTHLIKAASVLTVENVRVDKSRGKLQNHPKNAFKYDSYSASNETSISVSERRGKKSIDITKPVENTAGHWVIKFGVAALILWIIYLLIGLIDFESIENVSNHQYEKQYNETDNTASIENKSSSHEDYSLLSDYPQKKETIESKRTEVGIPDGPQKNIAIIKQQEIVISENKEGNVEIIKSEGEVIIVVNDVDASEADKVNNNDRDLMDANKGKSESLENSESSYNESAAAIEKTENKSADVIGGISNEVEVKSVRQSKHEVVGGNAENPADIVIVNKDDSMQSAEVKTLTALDDNKAKIELPEPDKSAKPQSKKYIHLVVKGDTLWHIAKRYVNNPWRYPELARLSKIKNPDLIYPGNKVIIIINYRKNKP